ncbi:DUF559 domain-containing protein [Flavobacterium sp.]|uniref:type IIG restriction enzyme/methyltransferase n=1 Tax=Flavobacterium sp. TaxID=239 RepID=UPI0025C65E82|nr:DUF559 domain-containing protein [Flavobacterium sp.]MBA4276735.1 hypothetical protein [Flavobacterium sp.]
MELKQLKPRKALNKAFLKVKPNRTEIEVLKTNLVTLLDRTNDTESEEFHKNLISDFLKDTYYKQNHFINTKGRNDLVIHNGPNANTSVGVIIEAKKPTNKAEMISTKKLNTKAFQELVLYYLRERITHKNLEVKHLVATNINEWFIFDEHIFERLFAQNKSFVRQFENFEASKKTTDVFYKEIAEPYIEQILAPLPEGGAGRGIEFTYFNIQDYTPLLRGAGGVSKHLPAPPQGGKDNSLIALFKLLSPEHLLKLPFTNDSNSLDKRFYSELLHIIGLTETKEGSKKLIERNKAGERHTGTILEDAIIQLDSLDKLSRLEKPNQFGTTQQERLFNVALELSITWINRILFLKLLEAQLITYHKTPLSRGGGGVSEYKFLNLDKIKNYDDLNSLFFEVLARKYDERNEDVKKTFEKIPYLNSSLFEPTDIEQLTLFISNLKDDKTIPIFSQTVLKDQQGKKRTGSISTLQYLLEFLDAYDFGAEGGEEIQEDNKTLINASVLGLIFEKINGYKDGSFYTPGFITMYMCRETIRKAVVQKFNETARKSPLEEGFRGVSNSQESNRRQIIPYNPKLKELARELRNNSTKSEIILWKELKGKFEGKYDFHRQKPLDNYIADFFCNELKLVIEIDGETHNWEEVQQKDFQKETRLNELGLNVLRFPDSDILKNLEASLETIHQYITGYEKGDLTELQYEESPLNPLTGYQGITDTPLNPLSRGDLKASSSNGEFKTLDDVYEQIGDNRLFSRQQANNIVNSIKICDPAVGSGHFLVSALNEIIAIKNDLKILEDKNGKSLNRYEIEVVNDELIITDEDGELFEYNPGSTSSPRASESQRVQETLFHEKQTIIENCLFGVDINSNSVKICRLRLWIELLKNAYYKTYIAHGLNRGLWELETLPNIDINIKCGNSLVSRFPIDQSITHVFKRGSKWTIDSYRLAVATYRNAESKEQKRAMERLIADIKSDFRSEISLNNPKVKKLSKLSGELFQMSNQQRLFDMSKKEIADWNKKVQQLTEEIKKLETEIEEIKSNRIFENAFEWRFEFPEVLNDDGDFVGFDVVIGNPPYLIVFDEKIKSFLEQSYPEFKRNNDLFVAFFKLAFSILKANANFSFITPNTFIKGDYFKSIRTFLSSEKQIEEIIDFGNVIIFEGVNVFCAITSASNKLSSKNWLLKTDLDKPKGFIESNTTDFILKNAVISRLDKLPKFEHYFLIKDVGFNYWSEGRGKVRGGSIGSRVFYNGVRDKLNDIPYIKGGDIQKYSISFSNNYLKHNWKTFLDENDTFRFSQELMERVPKIIYRQTSNKIVAAIDFNKNFNDKTVHIIVNNEENNFDLKAVLAILNSKMINYFFQSFKEEEGRAFAQVKTVDIKNLPFVIPNETLQIELAALVNQILKLKSQDNSVDTKDLENEIDQLVYQLYDLTEEEIKIVEGNG